MLAVQDTIVVQPHGLVIALDVDLRLLRYFLVLADELHFTRAAERLYIAQPALSNQIRRLERQVGFELFERSSRGVELTPAGAALVPHAQQALAAVSVGLAEAAAAAGREPVLRIDVLAGGLATPRTVLAALRSALPSVRLDVTSHGSSTQNRRLLSGELDLALCGASAPLDSGIAQEVIRTEPVGVSLPAGHPLAGAGKVALEDLAGELHYLPRDGFAPEWNAFVLALCTAAGFTPRRHPAGTDATETAMDLIGAGECVAISLTSTHHPPGTVLRRLGTETPPYSWALRWRGTAPVPPLVETARTVLVDKPSN